LTRQLQPGETGQLSDCNLTQQFPKNAALVGDVEHFVSCVACGKRLWDMRRNVIKLSGHMNQSQRRLKYYLKGQASFSYRAVDLLTFIATGNNYGRYS